jgi:hypothetical protein
MAKSWFYGAATLVLAHALWLSLILTQAHFDWVMPAIVVMLFVMINIAGIAAFITALKAPRDPLLLALSMAPLAALLAIAGNQLLILAGTTLDFAGALGSDGLFAVAFGYGIFVAVIGGVLGGWLAKRRVAEATIAVPEPAPVVQPAGPAEPAPADPDPANKPPPAS